MVWVNFLPWRQQRRRKQLRRDGLLLGVLLAAFMPTTLPLVEHPAFAEREQTALRQLKEANGQLDRLTSRLAGLEAQREALRRAMAVRESRQERLRAWQRFMRDLAAILPASLWLSDMNKTADRLVITGACLQLAEVEVFRQRLQRTALFHQVETGRLSRDAQGVIRFSLSARLAAQEGDRE